jgi:hypothetical protein
MLTDTQALSHPRENDPVSSEFCIEKGRKLKGQKRKYSTTSMFYLHKLIYFIQKGGRTH